MELYVEGANPFIEKSKDCSDCVRKVSNTKLVRELGLTKPARQKLVHRTNYVKV